MENKYIKVIDVLSALNADDIVIYEPSRVEGELRWRMDEDVVWTSAKEENKLNPFDPSTYPKNLVPECYYDRKCHIGLVKYPTSKCLFEEDPNAIDCLGIFLEEKKEA